MRCSRSGSKREIQTFLNKEEKSQINNLTYYLKELQKGRMNKTQSQQKEGNSNYQRGNK